MARLPFYVMATLGFLGLTMAFLNGSDAHFAVSVACSAALALHLLVPSGRKAPMSLSNDRLDILVTEEMPPLIDEPVALSVRRASGRGRSLFALACLLAGYGTLAYAYSRPTPPWAVASVACSAATLLALPAAARRRARKKGEWNLELWIGSLRMAVRVGGAPVIEAPDAAALRVNESSRLRWEEALEKIEALPATVRATQPAPEPVEEMVGDDVAAGLRARWGIPAPPPPRPLSSFVPMR